MRTTRTWPSTKNVSPPATRSPRRRKGDVPSLHEAVGAGFVFGNGAVDLACVGSHVLPGRCQIGRRQSLDGVQNLGIAHTQPTVGSQSPDRDPSIADAGITATAIRLFGNPTGGF